jgi:hypothetical protein
MFKTNELDCYIYSCFSYNSLNEDLMVEIQQLVEEYSIETMRNVTKMWSLGLCKTQNGESGNNFGT